MLLDRGVKSEISAVLAQLGKAMSNRNYFESWPKLMAGPPDGPPRSAWRPRRPSGAVAVPDHEDYDTWRNVTDFAVGRCEGLMDDPGNYGIHLDYIALREESLGSALTRVRDVLEDDDRHLAATLAGQREGGGHPNARGAQSPASSTIRRSFGSCATQRAERKAERQQQHKGRHMSMRI